MKVLFVTPDLSDNSMGRTYSLWLLGRALGWSMTVLSAHGDEVWKPLGQDEFSSACRRLHGNRAEVTTALAHEFAQVDLVIAVKPLPASLGLTLRALRRTTVPVIVDIDDPDIEVRTVWESLPSQARRWVEEPRRQWSLRRLARASRKLPSITSNPILNARYGGIIIPHARESMNESAPPPSREEIVVAFVGSPKSHKGIDDLRSAVAQLAHRGYLLVVTGDAPADAAPWEDWVGQVPFSEGMSSVRTADIIAIPSHRSSWARAQLPAKLIDAMMFGRAVIVTDVGPMPWALGGSGLVIPPDDPSALRNALDEFGSPDARAHFGKLAQQRADKEFSVHCLAPVLNNYCQLVVGRSEGRK